MPWRHPDGEIVFTRPCGVRANRLALADADLRGVKVVSPCSTEVGFESYVSPRFEFSRLSPDKRRIAAEMASTGTTRTTTVRSWVEDSAAIAIHDNMIAPEWLPDGRLLLAGDGLYITEVGGTPTRIDDGSLSAGVNNPDLDPSGKRSSKGSSSSTSPPARCSPWIWMTSSAAGTWTTGPVGR